ncbi:MAG: nucleotidyl transferase AbiEii/AbiGii toxin family protein [Anaerolineae bacterium]|nr:nucleotidyl transferase AbiEii/AbiGii toxin family protein [Anaerolineae bacterium]
MVAFHQEAITAGCQQALAYLSQHSFLDGFYLVGGTALALQIGHRISTDLDWFSSTHQLSTSEREQIRTILSTSGAFEVISEQEGALFTRLFGTDVSFVYQHHPLLSPTVEYRGVQLTSPVDIGLMKLAAINSRGTRRDFVDIFCLRETVTLDRLLELAPIKYADRPSFLPVAIRALAYFRDAEQQPMPRLLTPVQWPDVRAYCEAAARKLARHLSGLD